MGVARDERCAAFDLTLQLADAAEELMVELALLKQFLRLARERALGFVQLIPEPHEHRLGVADELCIEVSDLVGEAVDEADDSISALVVNPEDVRLAEQVHRRWSVSKWQNGGGKVSEKRSARMAVL